MAGDHRLIRSGDTIDVEQVLAEDAFKYIVYIDEASSTITYYGFASPGTDTSNAKWRIIKKLVNGTVTSFLLADGNSEFDNIWDNRPGLNYS